MYVTVLLKHDNAC